MKVVSEPLLYARGGLPQWPLLSLGLLPLNSTHFYSGFFTRQGWGRMLGH